MRFMKKTVFSTLVAISTLVSAPAFAEQLAKQLNYFGVQKNLVCLSQAGSFISANPLNETNDIALVEYRGEQRGHLSNLTFYAHHVSHEESKSRVLYTGNLEVHSLSLHNAQFDLYFVNDVNDQTGQIKLGAKAMSLKNLECELDGYNKLDLDQLEGQKAPETESHKLSDDWSPGSN